MYCFSALLEATFDFLTLESRIPEILEPPGFAKFLLNSTCRVFFPLSFCQETWFLMRNSKIPSLLECSWNSLELWNSPGNGQFFTKYGVLGINSYWFLSLNMNLDPKLRKSNFLGTQNDFWIFDPKNYMGCLKNWIFSILGPNSCSVTKTNMNWYPTPHIW